ncbi:ferredoxin [Actinophytocola oryzae]|uniref:Ferredoxin n=1 Tax=Actinophytocola oryzae TaxID=502181 RepID=A0A4R7W3Y3_9PSEU|nr:ferredoxin [Actinophytocola oryzae]TDV57202.1 ferredoxin [Actinophytocola oryzae]
MTRLHIDWTACDGRGLCVELLPEVLDRDPWGYPIPHRQGPVEVPDHLTSHAEKATTLCPLLALRLGDEGSRQHVRR